MKVFKSVRFWVFIGLLAIALFSCYYGLVDYDYFWQARSGGELLHTGDFHSIRGIIWGDKGLGEYLDHEWLCNIVAYFTSLLPNCGAFVIKALYASFVSVAIYYCVRNYINTDLSAGLMLICYLIFAMMFFKARPMTLSIGFFALELAYIKGYKTFKRNRYLIYLGILCVFWNNMHSGSLPLFYAILLIYWLFDFRSRKELLCGVIYLLLSLINPYGYKMLIFDLLHNGDKVMKEYNIGWEPVNTSTALGVVGFIMLVATVFFLFKHWREDKASIGVVLALGYLSLQSARHIMFFVPILCVYVLQTNLKVSQLCKFKGFRGLKKFFRSIFGSVTSQERTSKTYITMCVSLSCVGFLILSVGDILTSSEDFWKEYNMDYCSEELISLVSEYGDEGLYSTDCPLTKYGFKSFIIEAYPLVAGRQQARYMLEAYAGVSEIENIISYFELNSFLIPRCNPRVSFETADSPLYDYLANNPEYQLIYEDNYYSYFVNKTLVTSN